MIPLPLADMPVAARRAARYLFTDIDDTLTTDGLLTVGAYDALWRLESAGIRIVPVTGRPSGWCDHIARMWPVEAVVGENGAFYFAYDRGRRRMRREYLVGASDRAEHEAGLARIRDEVLAEVPGAAVSADQAYRIADLAIDFCEDVPRLPWGEVSRICEIAERRGATYKVSSIHVNIWFGAYDKLTCIDSFCARHLGRTLAALREEVVFIGDSPNDEPLFAGLPQSVGVANIRDFLPALTHPPRYLTQGKSGAGFKELADLLVQARVKR